VCFELSQKLQIKSCIRGTEIIVWGPLLDDLDFLALPKNLIAFLTNYLRTYFLLRGFCFLLCFFFPPLSTWITGEWVKGRGGG
jgi:hypothetical protein